MGDLHQEKCSASFGGHPTLHGELARAGPAHPKHRPCERDSQDQVAPLVASGFPGHHSTGARL